MKDGIRAGEAAVVEDELRAGRLIVGTGESQIYSAGGVLSIIEDKLHLKGGAVFDNAGTTLTITEHIIKLVAATGITLDTAAITLDNGASITNLTTSDLTVTEANVYLAASGGVWIGTNGKAGTKLECDTNNTHFTLTENNIVLCASTAVYLGEDGKDGAKFECDTNNDYLTITEANIVLAGAVHITSKTGPTFDSGNDAAFATFVTASQPGDKYFNTVANKWYVCITAGTMIWELFDSGL